MPYFYLTFLQELRHAQNTEFQLVQNYFQRPERAVSISYSALSHHRRYRSSPVISVSRSNQIEQHLFQKDSQAFKNSVTCGKGKKQNQNQRHEIKGKLLQTSEHVAHSSTPWQHLRLLEQLGAHAYLVGSILCRMLLLQSPLLSLGDTQVGSKQTAEHDLYQWQQTHSFGVDIKRTCP